MVSIETHGKISTAAIAAFVLGLIGVILQNPAILTQSFGAQVAAIISGILLVIYNTFTPGVLGAQGSNPTPPTELKSEA